MAITVAPAAAAASLGPGSQMSSQIVTETSAPRGVERERLAPRRERARLVEDAVVRQEALVVARDDLAADAQRRRVARTVAVEHGQPDEQRCGGLGRERVELARARCEEARAQDEIFRRVARQCELGGDDEVGPLTRGVGAGIGDARAVLAQGADGEIELGECDPHPSQPIG